MIQLENGHIFKFEMMGEFQSDGNWIHPTTSISTHEIILVLNGTVYITEDGTDYELHENDILVLKPCKIHGGYKTSTEPTSFYWFHFTTDLPVDIQYIADADVYDLKYYLKRLLHMSNSSYSSEALDSLSYLIFEELKNTQKKQLLSNPVLINQIHEYIKNNIARNITISEISNHFGYSPNYIGSLFKKNYNIGLKSYINNQRLKLAKDYLLTSNMTVKQIAHFIGYTDENTFIKFFTYHEKISPTVFKNKYFNTYINNR